MPQLPPEITFRGLSLLLITLLAVILVIFTLISMWKENRFGWPLRGIVWFYLVIIGSCAIIALLAGYVQKARSLERHAPCGNSDVWVGMKMQVTEVRIRPANEALSKPMLLFASTTAF
jgi:hypothetical protein